MHEITKTRLIYWLKQTQRLVKLEAPACIILSNLNIIARELQQNQEQVENDYQQMRKELDALVKERLEKRNEQQQPQGGLRPLRNEQQRLQDGLRPLEG